MTETETEAQTEAQTETKEQPEEAKEQKDDTAPVSQESGAPPMKWLHDRINGKSKVGTSRPPHPVCFVPPPVGRCPGILEQNAFCIFWGSIGAISPTNEKARYWLLNVGFLANVLGFLLTMYSCLAITLSYDVLKIASFSSAEIYSQDVQDADGSVSIDLGLRGAALSLPNYDAPVVIPFTDFCDLPGEELGRYLNQGNSDGEDICGVCESVSRAMVWSLMFSVVTFLPSFSTNILRLYSNYDVNCQKGFSTLFASVTVILSLITLLKYNNTCFAAFYSGTVPFDENLNPLDDDNTPPFFSVDFDWSIGPGLLCLYFGTMLKAIDIFVNLLVPSPSIARDKREQMEYELLPETAAVERRITSNV